MGQEDYGAVLEVSLSWFQYLLVRKDGEEGASRISEYGALSSFETHRWPRRSEDEVVQTNPHLPFIASRTVSPTNAAAREKASSLSPRKLTVRFKISFSF